MPKKLTDITITHISLVKAGANGKTFIYKSAADPGGYELKIDIKKTDDERGIVYGIVYAPGEVDSQGDFTDAAEIEKAAYSFMKARNTTNVDKDHDFNNTDAFVAESWIVKANDPVFPGEPEGSWAVAIKLESDELKKSAREGDLTGFSMAGTAQRTEVKKEDMTGTPIQRLFSAFADAVGEVYISFSTSIRKNKGDSTDMGKEMEDFTENLRKKVHEATTGVTAEIEKSKKEQDEKIEALEKSAQESSKKIDELEKANEELKKTNEDLGKTNEELTKSNEAMASDLKSHGEKIAELEKKAGETDEALKKSSQKKDVQKEDKNNSKQGVM